MPLTSYAHDSGLWTDPEPDDEIYVEQVYRWALRRGRKMLAVLLMFS